MAEASKGRVTITLGRTGQVVKRAADVEYNDRDYHRHPVMQMQVSGSKRSVRDRLGSSHNFDSYNKRQRGDGYPTSLSSNGLLDGHIGKDDLRLKLIQKTASRTAPSNFDQKTMDLREKLSRTVHQPVGSSLRTLDPQPRVPAPAPKEHSILGRMPSTRSADDLPLMDSSRNSSSPWTLDHIRRRSPDRIIGSSRGLSPPRNSEQIQRRPLSREIDGARAESRPLSRTIDDARAERRPLSRTIDGARAVSYMNKDLLDTRRPVSSSATFMAKPVLPSISSKPTAPVMSRVPPPGAILQKGAYLVEEPQTVEGLLNSLGLGNYAIHFKAEDVDMTALKLMGENDLKELGIPMGPRKKIILALLSRSKRQP